MSVSVPPVDRMKDRAFALDVHGLAETLRGLDEDERTEARRWLLKDTTFVSEINRHDPSAQRMELHGSASWMRNMCLVALCPPAEAARAMHWPSLSHRATPLAQEHTARFLAERPRAWAEKFAATAAGLRLLRRDKERQGPSVAWLVARGLADHDLPCPSGTTFLEFHLRDGWRNPVDASRIRAERLAPELIYLKLENGLAWTTSKLEQAVPELLNDKTLDRARLVDVCLQSLTSQTRVTAQRVVAKVLAALDLRREEVAGGLSFLTNTIATSDGSVGKVLLPVAIQAVEDATGLEELTRVIAARKERKQKELLLAGLRDPATSAAAGLDGVLAALEILAAGQEDARLLRGIEAARDELGAPVDPEERPHTELLGLWQLDIDPGPEPEAPWWIDVRRRGVDTYLDRRYGLDPRAFQFMLHHLLRYLSTSDDAAELVALCQRMRADGNLALTRFNELLEPVFLAGGLRALWPAALAVADDLASANRVLPGFPELLRMLSRYAPEVPDGGALPPNLTELAASTGDTKTQLEARALGAALQRVGVEDFAPSASETSQQSVRGLWDLRPRGQVLARLLDPHFQVHQTLSTENLQYLLQVGNGVSDRTKRMVPDLDLHLIHYLAREAQESGLDDVRRRVAAVRRRVGTDTGPTARAVELWQSGELTAGTYWDVLAADRGNGPGLDRVVFAWTCEQLVLLPTHPGTLSGPSRTDGSVVVSRLLDRIRALSGIAEVGPVDLLLAMTRLHLPPDDVPDAVATLDALSGIELRTDPAVTHLPGGERSFDVLPVLRAWIAAGGMTPTHVPVDMGVFSGITETDLRGAASHPEVRQRVWPARVPDEFLGSYTNRRRITLVHGAIPAQDFQRRLVDAVSAYTYSRDGGLNHLVNLARYDGVLAPSVTVPAAIEQLEAGELPLARFAECLRWLFERGGLRQLWPVGVAAAATASTRKPKPAGLAFLLSTLAEYCHEVPPGLREVPAEIAELAASKGSTKSHVAARDLVAALHEDDEVPA